MSVGADETRLLATHTWTNYATPATGLYIHNRIAQVKTYQLAKSSGVTESNPVDVRVLLRAQWAEALAAHEQLCQGHHDGLIGHVINHYDGDAYEGKAIREVGPYGALARSEALVLTRQLLDAAYAGDPAKPDRCPEYLGGTSTLPGGAPAGFGTSTGYHLKSAGDTYEAGYYVDTKRVKFDFQDASPMPARGVVVATQDTLGHETRMALDSYGLLPVKVIDAAQLETSVAYNYRTLQPSVVTDPNGNKTHFRYSPVGLVNKIWLQSNANQGGAEDKSELEYAYDFLNYARSRGTDTPQPVYARTTARLYHARVSDPGVPHSDETIESREYSDGFGRLIQKRTQAEDLCFGATGDDVGLLIDGKAEPGKARAEANATATTGSVIVSGWQTYDNKGRVVEKYEPFFDQGWQFLPDAKRGRHVTIFYDSRGQMIRIINPNGAEERIIFGVPGKVGAPNVNRVDDFEPTPWEIYTYDANDLAQETFHPDVGSLSGMPSPLTDVARDATHYCTPASVLLDGLGRAICRAQRNGHDPSTDWHLTRSAYDLRGNLLEVTDPLNRRAFTHIYDLLSRLLRVDSIDAGLHTSVLDAEGNLIEYRDSKGSIVLRQYDELNRPVGVWAINDAAAVQTLTRREKIIYGEKSGLPDPGERNLLDKAYVHYDEAGKLTFERYDFKGNLVEKVRRVVSDAAIAAAGGWTADWTGDPVDESPLEAQDYQTNTVFDALDRPISITYPKDARGNRAHLAPLYNRSGALQSVKLDGVAYVDSITYNAKGQRVIIAYGNHIMTRYAYDAQTFRLVRLRSEKFSMPDNHTWKSAPESDAYSWLFQDFTYEYDLVGNITSIMDRTPGGGLPSTPGALDRVFGYDPIYRLTHATGRACPAPPPKPIWDDTVRCHDVTQATAYQQWYRYDAADNMAELRHQSANTANGYTKHLSLAANQNGDGSNRLGSVTLGAGIYRYVYDENGNMIQENTDRHFTWDQADRMIEFRSQATPISIPSIEVRHFYGADGVRVKKWVRTSGTGTGESTTYIDGIFEHQRWHKSGQPGQTSYLHVLDNQNRVALVRVGDVHPDDRGPAVQYLLGDHLSSSNVVTGGDDVQGNTFINREEYFPFGETSFGSYDRKRYRFTGKERDEGTGLYYHGGRHYAPWLGRWISCDPGGTKDGLNRYGYVRNDPVRMFDEDGRDAAGFLVRTGAAVRTGTFAAGAGGVAAESALSGALGIAGLGLMVIMYAQSLIDETEAAMDSADEAFRRSIEMEKRFHAELAKAVKEGRLRNEDAVAIMRGQKDISDVEYKAPAALPAPTTQSDAAPEAEPQPAAGSSGKGIRCHATPGGTNPPPFDMGDVKSLASYRSGLRHLAEMTARYGGVLRTALALYDNLTGDVYLQVFEPDDQGVRRVVWEGIIGKCEIPEGLGPAPLGNNIEAPIRKLVESAMKQKFADKAPNAPGPDLVPVKP
ncbi:MAG: RHS repeat-associated core domain-containing protein [Caldilineaceae bacterium]|nr:RHS repeat-associated core domain-containing protein [Caldilineaceae bacterium]